MTRKQRRLAMIGGIGAVLAAAGGLILYAMSGNINLFRTPQAALAEKIPAGVPFRLGGMVERGTLVRGEGTAGTFVVFDCFDRIKVAYNQILPDLFKEGQFTIAEGALNADGTFTATSVLARHDENYVPREVADEMRKQGHNLDSMACEQAPKTADVGNAAAPGAAKP